MKRYASVIELLPEKLEEYKKLHAAAWPAVLAKIKDCNISNYSIFLRKFDNGKYYLFSYFEYVGSDFNADMAKIDADPMTQKWQEVCRPCHKPFNSIDKGQWWADMEEVFHCD